MFIKSILIKSTRKSQSFFISPPRTKIENLMIIINYWSFTIKCYRFKIEYKFVKHPKIYCSIMARIYILITLSSFHHIVQYFNEILKLNRKYLIPMRFAYGEMNLIFRSSLALFFVQLIFNLRMTHG